MKVLTSKASMRKLKRLSWKHAKKLFPNLNPKGDADKDGVINKKDCRPFNKRKHKELYIDGRVYEIYQSIIFDMATGKAPKEIATKLKEKGYTSTEIRDAFSAFMYSKQGYTIRAVGEDWVYS